MSASEIRSLARALLDLCKMRKLTIATAESCTGGLVCASLVDIPGSSAVVTYGFITYSNEAKHELLGVSEAILETFGAVSKEAAVSMATGALKKAKADLDRLRHRHRRSRRRDSRQAGRPRSPCRRRPRRPHHRARKAFRRHRAHGGADALGRRGA